MAGVKVELRIQGNWGHPRRVGLTQVTFIGPQGEIIAPLSVKSTGKVLLEIGFKCQRTFKSDLRVFINLLGTSHE